MLNRTQIFTQLQERTTAPRHDRLEQYNIACTLWSKMTSDSSLWDAAISLTRNTMQNWYTASWNTCRDMSSFIRYELPHSVVATDGSQIFPQPHSGIHWYVINIGICNFTYHGATSTAHLFTEPFLSEPLKNISEGDIALERTFQELTLGTACARRQPQTTLLLFDGILIPDYNDGTHYQQRMHELLNTWQQHIPCVAGYISMPQSRYMSQLIAAAAQLLHTQYDYHISDAVLMLALLPPYHCTPLWIKDNESRIKCYFYHTGQEIVRIEVPASFDDAKDFTLLHRMIMHQISLGYGYPLALAEAHIQATISSHDQRWFRQLLQQHTTDTIHCSHKQLRKQCIPL